MTRWKAAALHLLASIATLGCAALPVIALWYPPSMFELSGAGRLLLVLVASHVTAGPLLTLLVYRQGKSGMKFDLVAIAFLQAAFFAYGLHMLWASRPVFMVGNVDRLDLVFANEVSTGALAAAAPPWNGLGVARPKLAGLELPDDPQERMALMLQEIAGMPASAQPRLYVDYARVAPVLLSRSRDVMELAHGIGTTSSELQATLDDLGRKPGSLRWLPIASSRGSAIQLIDAVTAVPVARLAGDPWATMASADTRRKQTDSM